MGRLHNLQSLTGILKVTPVILCLLQNKQTKTPKVLNSAHNRVEELLFSAHSFREANVCSAVPATVRELSRASPGAGLRNFLLKNTPEVPVQEVLEIFVLLGYFVFKRQ